MRHYLSTWFAVDVLSTFAAVFDMLSFSSGDASWQRLQILRVLRVLRLAKLLRLLRGSRIFSRLEMRYSIDYGRLALIQSFLQLLVTIHWSACAWSAITSFETQLDGTWLVTYGYCVRAANGSDTRAGDSLTTVASARGYEHPSPIASESVEHLCASPERVYLVSLYFATMTITSVGYGDSVCARSERDLSAYPIASFSH